MVNIYQLDGESFENIVSRYVEFLSMTLEEVLCDRMYDLQSQEEVIAQLISLA
jgi:hypothetical protein